MCIKKNAKEQVPHIAMRFNASEAPVMRFQKL